MAGRIETLRRLEEAFRDYDVDAILACLTPDAELRPLRAQLEGKSYSGADGVRAMVAELAEDWEFIDQRLEQVSERGDEVVTVGHLRARSNATGVDLEVQVAWVLRFEGDLVAYGKAYSDPAEAMRDAGFEG